MVFEASSPPPACSENEPRVINHEIPGVTGKWLEIDSSEVSTEASSTVPSVKQADDVSGCGFWATVINITKAFVGAASFALPKAVEDGGLLGASVGIVVLAFVCHFALSRLARCSHLVPGSSKPTYPMVGVAALGVCGTVLAWFGMLAMTLGVCGSFVVFMTSRLQALTGMTEGAALCIMCLVVIVLSWIRSYRLLAYTSFFGLLALAFALIVQSIDVFRQDIVPISELEPFIRPDTYGKFLGNAGFLYLISTAILPLEQSMQETERPKFSKALAIAMVLVTMLNIPFAVVAYWGYGDCLHNPSHCVSGLVVDNLPRGMLTDIVNLGLMLDLLFTCIVFLLPMSQLLEKQLLDEARFGEWTMEVKRNGLRTLLVLSITAVACGVPVFDMLTGLSGGFGNNILGLILPPIFYFLLLRRRGKRVVGVARAMELTGCIVSVICGLIILALTVITFIQQVARFA